MVESKRKNYVKQFKKDYMRKTGLTYVFWLGMAFLCLIMILIGYTIRELLG